jgi:hypothetical protein
MKKRRATLESDLLRDNRTRLRRIFHPGKPISFPTSCLSEYPELPLMPQKPGDLGAEPSTSFAYLKSGKFHFTLNQDSGATWSGFFCTLKVDCLYLGKQKGTPGIFRRTEKRNESDT